MYKGMTMKLPSFDTPLGDLIRTVTMQTKQELHQTFKEAVGYEESQEEKDIKKAAKLIIVR